jgi:WD40 repeat protein
VVQTVEVDGGIRRVVFDPRNRDIVIASEAGHSQFGHVRLAALGMQRTFPWRDITAEARDIAYAPDGETIGIGCRDGGTWLYARRNDVWAYARDHDAEISAVRFSPDGRSFVTTDRRGIVVVRDVASTLAAASTQSVHDLPGSNNAPRRNP